MDRHLTYLNCLKLHEAFLWLTAFLLIGCEEAITFTQPMPPDGKELSKFPKRYQGLFVNKEDNSRLIIDDYWMVREYDFDLKFHRDSLKGGDTLIGDTLKNLHTGELTFVTVKDNYVVRHINFLDTLFVLSPSTCVTKFKGYLFLNTRVSDNAWTVQKVQLKNGVLSMNSIETQEEISMLNEFEELNSDTIASPYSPTRKEFRTFIRNEGFRNGEQFVKIK